MPHKIYLYKTRLHLPVVLCIGLGLAACSNDTATNNSTADGTAHNRPTRATGGGPENFVAASNAAIPAVVHIKTRYSSAAASAMDPYGGLYGGAPQGPVVGSGSGVAISADGYIATNNHVVENADVIEVIFPDRRSFAARLVGRDPNTDLALLKVEGKNLPVVALGNSDGVQVGEWVLAVGYPLSLNSTVTAGIISAKGRSIGIINNSARGSGGGAGSTAIESFLQTDAAINPGNSGGALVNTAGELIGINTAIASQTGSYAGYAFAIPINLARKILDDLKQYGSVKRGVLGISFPSPAAEDQYLRQQGINPGSVKGVYITGVQQGSAADAAGLREGDIIQSIDGAAISTSAEFSERIARHRPGDKVQITYIRNSKTATATAILKEEETSSRTALNDIYDRLGATFSPLTPGLAQRFSIRSGVVVEDVRRGGFFDQLGIPPGTIIVFINGRAVGSPQDIEASLLSARSGNIQILAIAPDGSRVAFNFSLGA